GIPSARLFLRRLGHAHSSAGDRPPGPHPPRPPLHPPAWCVAPPTRCIITLMLLIGQNRTRTCQGLSRRGLLQAGLMSAFGLTLPDLLRLRDAHANGEERSGKGEAARGERGRARGDGKSGAGSPNSAILLWLWGGPSHLDSFDPKPDAPSEYRGPFKPIATKADGIQVTELFPELARRAD